MKGQRGWHEGGRERKQGQVKKVRERGRPREVVGIKKYNIEFRVQR